MGRLSVNFPNLNLTSQCYLNSIAYILYRLYILGSNFLSVTSPTSAFLVFFESIFIGLTLFLDSAPLDKKNIEHDYAVIELAKKAGDDYMRVTISPEVNQLPVNRIHFR